jgi:hypothetical protein
LANAGATQKVRTLRPATGGAQRAPGAPNGSESPGPTLHASAAQRPVILHYHLFKNAGTSVDELLRQNFGSNWAAQEFGGTRRDNAAAVADFIRNNPRLCAISSHTALLPVPSIAGVNIFPIIFIRHPIDRLRSVYDFERRQNVNTAGARLAKTHDFAGYLRELLRNPRHRQIRNFQTFRLSHNEPARRTSELECALATILAFPFVGLVERFDGSLRELEARLRPLIPEFRVQPVHRNAALSRPAALADRLAGVAATLGRELYDEICTANADDLAIYNRMAARFEAVGMRS